jgi:hypothetical protein
MALHPVKLPKSAAYLFRIVVLQKRLLKGLADPALDANRVDTAWVQHVWSMLDAEWVRKFCLGGQESILHPLKAIAAANPVARQALYDEFRRQNKVEAMLDAGGDFQDLEGLPGFTTQLAAEVKEFFIRCYKLLSTDAHRQWNGYEFNGNCSLTKRKYKDDFCSDYPTKVVCPYCDGEIGTPELDHYLNKARFPLLACSPWNLVPVCGSCNDVVTAKGERPAITLGPPHSTADWLHPFFGPASLQVQIKLSGTPKNSIPELHSPDPAEQVRLLNHTGLIRSLSTRWTNVAAAYYDRLIGKVSRDRAVANVDTIVMAELESHQADRGRFASTMIHAAVCQAILDRRPEYLEEFTTPNALALE